MHVRIESFDYPDSRRPVLSGIELRLHQGEGVLVAGGAGSGKTTLGLILAGVLPGQHRGAMRGHIRMGGESLQFPLARTARIDHQRWAALVGYAGQDAAAQLTTIAPTVAEEIAFPLENAGMARNRMKERVDETAAALGLSLLLDRDPGQLSGGQQKLVSIAAAVARRPDFLVLDEPLAGLDFAARSRVTAAITALVAEGMGIIELTRDLSRTGLASVQQVVLLDGGRAVFTGPPAEASQQAAALQLPVIGGRPDASETSAAFGEPAAAGGAAGRRASPPVVAAQDLRFSYGWRKPRPWRRKPQAEPVLDGVNLTVAAGERVAVTGANGSGKSTLLRLLTGLSVPQEGAVELPAGARNGAGPDPTALLGALLQNPGDQLFERTVRREVGAGLPRSLDGAVREGLVDTALRRCGLLEAGALHPYELPASGQRLAVLAALLVRAPALIALDEPTVSLDRPGLEILSSVLAAEAERGAAIVMVTHDLDFALRTCTRLVVLSEGTAVADGPFTEVLDAHFGSGIAYGVCAPASWRR